MNSITLKRFLVRMSLSPAGFFCFAAALVVACGKSEARSPDTGEAPPLLLGAENIAVADSVTLRSGPAISGDLAAERAATITAQVSGTITSTMVEPGQRVRRGMTLARIDASGIRDSYLSSRSAVRTAGAALAVARRNAERAETLAAAGAIADRDLESARWNAMNAATAVADARAHLASSSKQLGFTTVRSPLNGIVSDRPASSGDVVQVGTPLVTVVDPSSMRLEAAVPAEQLRWIKVGSPVSFQVSGFGEQEFTGRVTRIFPSADPATRQVRIFVSIPNRGQSLVAGLFAEGRVAAETRRGIAVPLTALDAQGAKPMVHRIKGGKVEGVAVEVGLRDDVAEQVELTAGISVHDTVLVGAAQGLTHGTTVQIRRPAVKQE